MLNVEELKSKVADYFKVPLESIGTYKNNF